VTEKQKTPEAETPQEEVPEVGAQTEPTGPALEATTRRRRTRRRPRPETRDADDDSVWPIDTFQRLQAGTVTPIVGDSISTSTLFGDDYPALIEKWAKQVGYPWTLRFNRTRVAQFYRMREDARASRSFYLSFLQEELLERADNNPNVSDRQWNKVIEGLENKSDAPPSISRIAEMLGFADFKSQPQHPLSLLASLPLPVYITTSYHQFLEIALEQHGKTPVSEVYPWRKELRGKFESIYERKPGWQPDTNSPLVYHLFGRDDYADSLVLTENDYLDFLVRVSQDLTLVGDLDGLPTRVEDTLVLSTLFLLGYDMEVWDFRVLFRGLIKAKNDERNSQGVAIQLDKTDQKDKDRVRRHLENYFLETSKLKVFWGPPTDCLSELKSYWEGNL